MAKTAFSAGDQSTNTKGTRVTAAFLNALQNHRHDGADADGSCPSNYAADTGAANAYAVALTPPIAAHVEGMPLYFKAAHDNTGASTLAVDGMATKAIIMPDGSVLSPGAIKTGQAVICVYTGAAYMLASLITFPTVPVGTIIHTVQSSAPAGFLKANGAAVSRTTYSTLFALIGTDYGNGNGSTTFTLPDLRAEFIRSWDDSRGVDSGRTLGSGQLDAFQGHFHSIPVRATGGLGGSNTGETSNGASVTGVPSTDGTNGTPRTAAETRPRNIALLACIKY